MESLNCIPLPMEEAEVLYFPNFINEKNSQYLYDKFLQEFDWKVRDANYISRNSSNQKNKYKLNRATCAFGDKGVKPPEIWGEDLVVMEWTPELLAIKEMIEKVTSLKFNICLGNYYATGSKGIGYHADNEERGSIDGIASISLGAKRKFIFQQNVTLKTHELFLENGSLLLMGRGTQENYKHCVPVEKGLTEGRINLTFRWFDVERYLLT